MDMKYRWILIGVMFAGCWIAYTYTPHSAIVQDTTLAIGEMKAIVRIPDTQKTVGTMQDEIEDIKASLTRIENSLAAHVAGNEIRFAKIEQALREESR